MTHPYHHPLVNLNGTSKEELDRQTRAVWEAARILGHALAEAQPHGRDFPHDQGQFKTVYKAHLKRRAAVAAVETWAVEQLLSIHNQGTTANKWIIRNLKQEG